MLAASKTVPSSFKAYSSQSSWLRPVVATGNVIYRIERVADGRAYATRVVRAFQSGSDPCAYVATVSFQNYDAPTGNVLNYGLSMPDLGDIRPDDISPGRARNMVTTTISKSVPLTQRSSEKELPPFDWRPLELTLTDKPTQFVQQGFVRSPSLSTDSPATCLAALGYLSDDYFMGPPMHANPEAVGVGLRNVAMGASLNHNISFHDPTVKLDDWMVCQRNTTWGADGRVLSYQRFWGWATGRLVMTCSQEALIRLKDKARSKL